MIDASLFLDILLSGGIALLLFEVRSKVVRIETTMGLCDACPIVKRKKINGDE